MSNKIHSEEAYRAQADPANVVPVAESPSADAAVEAALPSTAQAPDDSNDMAVERVGEPEASDVTTTFSALNVEPALACVPPEEDGVEPDAHAADDSCSLTDALPTPAVFKIDARLFDRTAGRDCARRPIAIA